MRRKLAVTLALAATTIGLAVLPAAPAAASPSLYCGTTDYSIPDIYAEAGGQIKILGWARGSYVGQYSGFSGTWRVWHFTYQVNGGGTNYTGARGVQCNAANEEVSSVDLTRETLTASDHPKCGTISYTVGSNSYTYLGSRYNNGDKFRYWGQTVFSGMFVLKNVTAVRCN